MAERVLGWVWSLGVHALFCFVATVLVLYPGHNCVPDDVAYLTTPQEPLSWSVQFKAPRDLFAGAEGQSTEELLRPGFSHGGPDLGRSEAFSPSRVGGESAVTAALFWLARHQKSDGSWGASDARCCRDDGDPGFDHRLTALALLAFRRAGYSEEGGLLFGPVMKKAAQWLDARRGNGTEEQFPFEALLEAQWLEKETLLSTQKTELDGCEDGSWDLSADRWALEGGRAYATALNALGLLAR